MRIVVAGSSGFIGRHLTAHLHASGHDVLRLVRRAPIQPEERHWDPASGTIERDTFSGVDAVINLCGAPLAQGRWSQSRKQLLTDSRLEPTEVLTEAIAEHDVPIFISASGIHFYGDTGEQQVDENAPVGSGFLPELCAAWEGTTAIAAEAGTRVVLLRTAPVLAGGEGILGPLAPLFRLGLGTTLGSGTQSMPWISLPDHLAAVRFLLENETMTGPVNLAAPQAVTNAEFTKMLARTLRRPAPWRVPAFLLRTALGETAEEMVLTGPQAVPRILEQAGFRFTYPILGDALAAVLCGRP